MRMTGDERRLVHEMLEAQALVPVDGTKINTSNGLGVVCCSDGDQMQDLMANLETVCTVTDDPERVHTFAMHGGGALASPTFPRYEQHSLYELVETWVREMRAMKEIRRVVLVVHVPCGCAEACDLALPQLIQHAVAGRQHLNDNITGGLMVSVMLHVDFHDGTKQLLHVNEVEFLAWNERWLAREIGEMEPEDALGDEDDEFDVTMLPLDAGLPAVNAAGDGVFVGV